MRNHFPLALEPCRYVSHRNYVEAPILCMPFSQVTLTCMLLRAEAKSPRIVNTNNASIHIFKRSLYMRLYCRIQLYKSVESYDVWRSRSFRIDSRFCIIHSDVVISILPQYPMSRLIQPKGLIDYRRSHSNSRST